MENYPDVPEQKKGFTPWKLIKWLVLALAAVVYGILVVRCSLARDPKIVSEVLTDENFLRAYQEDPASVTVWQYPMSRAWVAVEEGRLIEFNCLYYVTGADELQVSVKYNPDILPHVPSDEVAFRFRLTDEDGNVYDTYTCETEKPFRFRYVRLAFSGIKLEKAGETDPETGKPVRKTYTLHLDARTPDGDYKEYCDHMIYDGSTVCKEIPFTVK